MAVGVQWVLGGRAGGWWVMVGVHKVVTSG